MLDSDRDAHTEASTCPLTLLGGDLASRFTEYEVMRAATRPLVEDAISEVARIACLVGISVTEFAWTARGAYHAVRDGEATDGDDEDETQEEGVI